MKGFADVKCMELGEGFDHLVSHISTSSKISMGRFRKNIGT